jgi:hypothetical protein
MKCWVLKAYNVLIRSAHLRESGNVIPYVKMFINQLYAYINNKAAMGFGPTSGLLQGA